MGLLGSSPSRHTIQTCTGHQAKQSIVPRYSDWPNIQNGKVFEGEVFVVLCYVYQIFEDWSLPTTRHAADATGELMSHVPLLYTVFRTFWGCSISALSVSGSWESFGNPWDLAMLAMWTTNATIRVIAVQPCRKRWCHIPGTAVRLDSCQTLGSATQSDPILCVWLSKLLA